MTAAAQIAAWLAASSQNDRSPKGDLILRGPFGELVTVGLDDVPPEAPAGCLPLFTLTPGFVPTWAAPEGQPRLSDRAAARRAWLAGAGQPDFPAVAVLRVAAGAPCAKPAPLRVSTQTRPLWASPQPRSNDLPQGH